MPPSISHGLAFAILLSAGGPLAAQATRPGRPVAAPDATARDDRSVPAVRREGDTLLLSDGRRLDPLPRLLGVREQFVERTRWLERRHALLLPMMRRPGVAMWIVVNEEFRNDPLTEHVAPPLTYVSRRDVHVFTDGGDAGLLRHSNYWRPTATYARFFEPLPAPRSDCGTADLRVGLRELVTRTQPATIALAIGGARGQDGGRSKDSHDLLARRRLSNEVITPGVTTAADVAWWFNDQVARLGVGATQWFEVHTAVQRFDPATGRMIPYVHPAPDDYVFQPGDVVHLDCGFNYMGLASDWQKVADILRPGEVAVPAGLELALQNGIRTREALRSVARPGMTGYEAAEATVRALAGAAFTPSIDSHPIGTHGHGMGPQVNARGAILAAPPERDSRLRLGSYRSIELSATTRIPEWNDGALTIPFEDDAELMADGYVWFRPPQQRWYLIRSAAPQP